MIDYCYITKFKYITQAELNFIDEVSKFKKIEVYILNTNQIYNLYYKLLITLVFKIEPITNIVESLFNDKDDPKLYIVDLF